VLVYTIGLFLAILLTATSFWMANTSYSGCPAWLWDLRSSPSPKMRVHLVFFLITTGPDNTNNVLALAFGVLIVALVIIDSLWIMTNLNENMMPDELMNLHMQH
jgi:cytochrome o ubiquinol oxidase operon protein cyoD